MMIPPVVVVVVVIAIAFIMKYCVDQFVSFGFAFAYALGLRTCELRAGRGTAGRIKLTAN